MAKQRVVNTYFWNDPFIMKLKADEKLLFLYALTNPQTDLCGAYELAMEKIVFETRMSEKKILEIFAKFEAAGKICYRNGWVVVRNFAKHQVNNPKVSKGIERSLNSCPDWVKEIVKIGFDRLSPKTALLPVGTTSRENSNPQGQPNGNASVAELDYLDTVLTGLRSRLNLNILSDETGWSDSILWSMANGFPTAKFLECFDLLSKQKWRKGRITPKNVADNLPELEKVKADLEQERNGSNKTNSRKQRDSGDNQSTDEFLASIGANPAR